MWPGQQWPPRYLTSPRDSPRTGRSWIARKKKKAKRTETPRTGPPCPPHRFRFQTKGRSARSASRQAHSQSPQKEPLPAPGGHQAPRRTSTSQPLRPGTQATGNTRDANANTRGVTPTAAAAGQGGWRPASAPRTGSAPGLHPALRKPATPHWRPGLCTPPCLAAQAAGDRQARGTQLGISGARQDSRAMGTRPA